MKLEAALNKARYFLLTDFDGPRGDVGSFDPISTKYDESNNKWVIKANIQREGVEMTYELELDDNSNILKFERV